MRIQKITDPYFNYVLAEIMKDISPAAVVCFGHSSSVSSHINCFQINLSERHHYDLLIVRGEHSRYNDHEIIDLINNRFAGKLTVNVLSHSKASVMSSLQEQNPFFSKIFEDGVILHQNDDAFEKMIRAEHLDTSQEMKLNRECKRAFELAQSFMSLASDAMGSGIHDAGVFLLHQAMEQMCIASVKAHLRYRPTTHNLAKLIALVSCYLPFARTLFPCTTNEERELFDFLKKAYSDVRYKTAYRIPPHIAFSLLERVSEFHNLLEETYMASIPQE